LRGVVGELREEGIVNQDDISMIGVYDNDSWTSVVDYGGGMDD
jgi:hypothetical protein